MSKIGGKTTKEKSVMVNITNNCTLQYEGIVQGFYLDIR